MVVGHRFLYNSHHASAPHSSDSRTLLSTWFLQGKKQILKGNPEVRSLLSRRPIFCQGSDSHLAPKAPTADDMRLSTAAKGAGSSERQQCHLQLVANFLT